MDSVVSLVWEREGEKTAAGLVSGGGSGRQTCKLVENWRQPLA